MASSGPSPFLLGVNYPWLDYAEDFGCGPRGHLGVSSTEKYERVKRDFADMRACGVRVVRWFLFGDGRGGFSSKNGIPRRPDEFLLKDVAAALQLAQAYELQLCFSLIDHLWLQDRELARTAEPHERVLQFAAGREALLQYVLLPLFTAFREHPALFAWEVANEPEWAIREFHRDPAAKLPYADFRAFAAEVVKAIHEYGRASATLGSARLLWLRAWSELQLDFYQAHYYPSTERDLRQSLPQQLSGLRSIDKPLWLGEIPAHDTFDPGYSLEGVLTECLIHKLHGAAVWRWTKPEAAGSDTMIGSVEPVVIQTWLASQRMQELSA